MVSELARRGVISGVRIDHPDGLADPAGYLDALRAATGGVWTVVEKILASGERLPSDWRCDGTTGYDALNVINGLLIYPSAEPALTSIYREFTEVPTHWADVVRRAKTDILDNVLVPEVGRLSRAVAAELSEPPQIVEQAVRALLVAMPVYRAYVRPGRQPGTDTVDVLDSVVASAAGTLPPDAAKVLDRVHQLLLHGPAEIVTRFQQTTGPVMAKGVEDTAFYRFHRLASLCEVGGEPDLFGRSLADFHAFCTRTAADHPTTMTTLSTHDTKRSEDVRARLAVLSEIPDEWRAAVHRWSSTAMRHWQPPGPDRTIEYLCWQTVVGAWPLDADRMAAYVEKAAREAGQRTAWVDGDAAYEQALTAFVRAVLADEGLCADLAGFVARISPAASANSLAQKLVQLTMPGVPDVYQGCELVDRSLVDPDNRRPVDFTLRQRLLRDGGDTKLHVVTTALRARRDRADCFGPEAAYTPLPAEGPASDHVIAFCRGDGVVTVATRLAARLAEAGGWRDTSIVLPAGTWTDLLSGRQFDGRRQQLAALLEGSPVALLGMTPPGHS